MNMKCYAVVLSVVTLLGCANQPNVPASSEEKKPPGLGETKTTAIEVCRPQGQRAYLDRLQCSDGSSATYRRVSNVGERNPVPSNLTQAQQSALLNKLISGAPLQPGEPDYHIVDMYEVSCGNTKRMVFMDMYHCHQSPPNEAPTGFVLRKVN
jgi:hypothetical protein